MWVGAWASKALGSEKRVSAVPYPLRFVLLWHQGRGCLLGTGPAPGELASAPYRLPPGQAVPFLHTLPEGVPTTDQNLLRLLLACLGLEVVFVVGQGLQKEGACNMY